MDNAVSRWGEVVALYEAQVAAFMEGQPALPCVYLARGISDELAEVIRLAFENHGVRASYRNKSGLFVLRLRR
jgi:hypothetical protein